MRVRTTLSTSAPGLLISVVIAMAAAFVSEHYGAPVMLMALLLGMAFNFLAAEPRFAPGLRMSGKTVLRVGVALLGLRITYADIQSLGLLPLSIVVSGLVVTVLFGLLLGRSLKLSRPFALLTAGAVAICGASAAMAISAVLPRYAERGRDTAFTVIAVTALSTVAMIVYPMITAGLGLEDIEAGVFLGSTIHDVAQVVGAGYMVSNTAGDVATYTKLLRVALLIPMIAFLLVVMPQADGSQEERSALLPPFLTAFVILVIANSMGVVPEVARMILVDVSRICLVVAIAGLGVNTSLKDMVDVGGAAISLVVAETVVLALLALAVLKTIGN